MTSLLVMWLAPEEHWASGRAEMAIPIGGSERDLDLRLRSLPKGAYTHSRFFYADQNSSAKGPGTSDLQQGGRDIVAKSNRARARPVSQTHLELSRR